MLRFYMFLCEIKKNIYIDAKKIYCLKFTLQQSFPKILIYNFSFSLIFFSKAEIYTEIHIIRKVEVYESKILVFFSFISSTTEIYSTLMKNQAKNYLIYCQLYFPIYMSNMKMTLLFFYFMHCDDFKCILRNIWVKYIDNFTFKINIKAVLCPYR